MATRTTVTLVDDIDGGTAEETVGFGLDGAAYEIDLSAANAGELRAALERYVAAARRTGGRRSAGADTAPAASSASSSSSSRERSQEIRAWANENGAGLSSRGRIPGSVVAAFEAGDPSLLTRADESAPESAPVAEPTPAPDVEPAAAPAAEAGEETRGRDGLTVAERERIRAWAIDEGIEVKARGQLKKDLISNYQAWAARQG